MKKAIFIMAFVFLNALNIFSDNVQTFSIAGYAVRAEYEGKNNESAVYQNYYRATGGTLVRTKPSLAQIQVIEQALYSFATSKDEVYVITLTRRGYPIGICIVKVISDQYMGGFDYWYFEYWD